MLTEKRHSCGLGKRAGARSDGIAAVEFALVLPMLLLVVFGAIEFGIAFYDKAVITNASREAARAGVMLQATPMTSTAIQKVAQDICTSSLVTFGSSAPCTFPVAIAGTPCTATGTLLTVAVSYTFTGFLLGPLLSPLTGPVTISGATTMRCE